MRSLFSGVSTWSWFSEEKGIYFNGHRVIQGNAQVLIDPPPLSDEDQETLLDRGISDIILTNRDHIREAKAYKNLFGAAIWAPKVDAPAMTAIPIDHTYQDGDILPADIRIVSILHSKSFGESALYLNEACGIFILGDALIGKPDGALTLLPSDKIPNMAKAKEGLRRLLNFSFDAVLVGDGTSILQGARGLIEKFLKD